MCEQVTIEASVLPNAALQPGDSLINEAGPRAAQQADPHAKSSKSQTAPAPPNWARWRGQSGKV